MNMRYWCEGCERARTSATVISNAIVTREVDEKGMMTRPIDFRECFDELYYCIVCGRSMKKKFDLDLPDEKIKLIELIEQSECKGCSKNHSHAEENEFCDIE